MEKNTAAKMRDALHDIAHAKFVFGTKQQFIDHLMDTAKVALGEYGSASHPAPQAAAEGAGSIRADKKFLHLLHTYRQYQRDEEYDQLIEHIDRVRPAAPERAAMQEAGEVEIKAACYRVDWSSDKPASMLLVAAMKEEIADLRAALAARSPVAAPAELSKAFITLESSGGEGRSIVLKFNQRGDAYAVHDFLLKSGVKENPAPAPDAEAIRSAALEEAYRAADEIMPLDNECNHRDPVKVRNEILNAINRLIKSQPSPAVKSAEPNFIDAQITNKAHGMYRAMVDSAGVHGNRFPSWRELSEDEQNGWKHQARSALASAKSAEPTGGAA